MTSQPKLWIRYQEALIAAALFLGALGLYSFDWFYSLSDGVHNLWGGVSTVGAERILGGEIPYRDFWTIYAPGHFYLLALLFRIFGTHLFVEVVAASVVCAVTAWLCYRLVVNLIGRRLVALACAGIFVAATYNTGYFRRLGSYPPAILSILIALHLMMFHYKTKKLGLLVAAGLATGAVVVFKHDVGGYTAIAIVAGLIAQYLLTPPVKTDWLHSLVLKLFVYSAGIAVIVVPVSIYFAILAGADMLQDLIVFPLTDFRFARPESYPGLLPFGIYDESRLQILNNFCSYLNLTVPFGLLVVGSVAVGWAVPKHKPEYVAPGVTFSVAYLLHYAAAHVQINTHVITMSVYAVWLGAIFYDFMGHSSLAGRSALIRLLPLALVVGWCLSLVARPAYLAWQSWQQATTELKLAKVSGFKVSPTEARTFAELSAFVDSHIPPSQELFVGLHRHDIVIIGDVMIYFILDRPNATRYQELHPAIADTAHIQQEIISELEGKNISLIITKHISLFSDEALERVKADLCKNLPQIGATDLDEFLHQNYVETREIGPYEVWERTEPHALR